MIELLNARIRKLEGLVAGLTRELEELEVLYQANKEILAGTETRLREVHRARTDLEYKYTAIIDFLGPKATELIKRWEDTGVQRVHYSWGPDAHKLTGEERAEVALSWSDLHLREPVEIFDSNLKTHRFDDPFFAPSEKSDIE